MSFIFVMLGVATLYGAFYAFHFALWEPKNSYMESLIASLSGFLCLFFTILFLLAANAYPL